MKKIAKIIRGITVPPAIVTVLFVLLYFLRDDVIPNPLDLVFSLFFLAVVPVLAYPLQAIVPAFRPGGQKMKRKLAFILSIMGYIAAFTVSLVRGAVPNLAYIDAVYLCSVLVLTALNVFTPWHASGHACSIVGPIALLACFFGWRAILAGAAVIALSFWSSVYLKRHTVREYLLGAASPLLSALMMYPLFMPTF
ncbi:MAG: hypothetical protein IKM42_06090 [Clostridia bacterium]|nr:hypothetical protein [Clostridia bacterium]MBR3863206.1 hypothetical protein [Clostridia bacterium]